MHKSFLMTTLELAKKQRGHCAPNPCVGAIIVKNNTIIAKGLHICPGKAHAERIAIEQAGADAEGATLYVSLEPCSHSGRTPPCVNAIIQAKIKTVFFAYQDPNPLVCGKGQAALQQAGIVCEHIALDEINHFYRSYHYWHLHKKPWITVKIAMSLDAKIAFPGKKVLLSHEKTHRLTHQLRRTSDAILTTINTVLVDNPQMNARCDQETLAKTVYVLDSQLRFPGDARLLETTKQLILLHSQSACLHNKKALEALGIRCISIEAEDDGLSLSAATRKIGADGIHDLWVEAGANCNSNLLKQQLANEMYLYITPKILGKHGINAFTEGMPLFKKYFSQSNWQLSGDDMVWHFSSSFTPF